MKSKININGEHGNNNDISKRRGLDFSVLIDTRSPIKCRVCIKCRGFEVHVLINAGGIYQKFYGTRLNLAAFLHYSNDKQKREKRVYKVQVSVHLKVIIYTFLQHGYGSRLSVICFCLSFVIFLIFFIRFVVSCVFFHFIQ